MVQVQLVKPVKAREYVAVRDVAQKDAQHWSCPRSFNLIPQAHMAIAVV